jgi:NitT/TauT family transport system permease protein
MTLAAVLRRQRGDRSDRWGQQLATKIPLVRNGAQRRSWFRPLGRRPGQVATERMGLARFQRIAALAMSVSIIAVWWFLTRTGGVPRFFLPTPTETFRVGLEMVRGGEFWADLLVSLGRICGGFLLASAVAIPCGIWMGRSRFFNAVVLPPISFIRFVPMPAVIPLMILWFGSGEWGKVMIISLGVFFQLVLMVADAVAYVPDAYYDISHSLGATAWQRLIHFTIRAAAPEIWDSLRINFGLAWATLIFAEILGATSGLGYMIVRSQRYLLTESIFVAVLVIGMLGIVTDKLFQVYYHRWFPWSVQVQRAEAQR